MFETDSYGGKYLKIITEIPAEEHIIEVPKIPEATFICASYRTDPFWFRTKACCSISEIPDETLFFAVKHKDGTYSAYYSLACRDARTSFCIRDGKLKVSAITGDSQTKVNSFYAYYTISGVDFYQLISAASKSICEKFGTTSLREEKKRPSFMNLFGWCTWDSFYRNVSKDNIKKGLESFQKGGVMPKFILIDDGWQTVDSQSEEQDVSEIGLTKFQANEKFDNCLHTTVEMAKQDFGVEMVFVWHAMLGYWGGVSLSSEFMKKYLPTKARSIPPIGIKNNNLKMWENEQSKPLGVINPKMAETFYDDFHSYLQGEGIDGVKVDVQGRSDGLAEGLGGRVAINEAFHSALEASTSKHFDGNLINCMSNSNDVLYHIKNSNMMRSSDDFMPRKPETHIRHIYDNSVNSIWLSEFTCCDWDMFQTTHEYGPFHAAARSISGGPVYVSDKVDEHNFDIIKALTTDEGKVLLPEEIARPTTDCLFADVLGEKTPFKIFNRNKYCGVVGIFSGEDDPNVSAKTIQAGVSDVDGFPVGKYAVYSSKTGEAFLTKYNEKHNVSLKAKEYDILTFAPVVDGFAPIGIIEKFNSGGAIASIKQKSNSYEIELLCSGTLLLYSEKELTGAGINNIGNGFYKILVSSAGTVII